MCIRDREKYRKDALQKLGYISLHEQQGFECEHGVGPLYQGVGRPGCAELGYRLWDRLNYKGKCMLLDTGLVHLIATTSTTGQRRLGIENQRSSGFSGSLSPCFLPAAIKQKNPLLTWSALKIYHRNQKRAHSKWWLHDPVGALCAYQFYKYGLELDAKNQEQWIISWGGKARFTSRLNRSRITDEQSYIRSRTGLTAHFADKRLSSSGKARKAIQWNPGGLRHLAREDDVIVAPDNKLSKPRLIFADMEQADSEYIGSEMYRGVFASQYVLRQTLLAAAGKDAASEKLINASHTFLALDELLIVKLRYTPLTDIKKDSAYRITHLRSKKDKMDKKGRYVLSRLATSVGGAKPGQHALVSLDGQKIFTSATPQKPRSAKIIKDSLSDWGVPFSQWKKGVQQTRLIAIKPFAGEAEIEELLASTELPATGSQNTLDAMALKNGGKKYYLVTGAKDAVVKFKGHEFKITGSTPEIINVFAFDDSGKLDGFSVYGTQCCVDGVKLFDAKKPSYVSLTDLDGRYYASSDQSAPQR